MNRTDIEKNFTGSRSFLDADTWLRIIFECRDDENPEHFLDRILFHSNNVGAPGYVPELARLEWRILKIQEQEIVIPGHLNEMILNPSLDLLDLCWKKLTDCLNSSGLDVPEPGSEFVMIWKHPEDGKVHAKAASAEDLLMLKMIFEKIERKEVARIGDLPFAAVDAAIERAVEKGILVAPASSIQRDFPIIESPACNGRQYLTSPAFTLQWHVTQACDLHCRHCYDRSNRSVLILDEALRILDDLDGFCTRKHVKGQISFTGGNPLLHPDFSAIYQAAANLGFTLAILGNPAPRERLEALISIQRPSFFQVSLEGLPEYNDFIRGRGHFERVMNFLDLLRDLDIYSMVMLTLTRDNLGQVIPLGERLRGRADAFYFNRLARVGEGASLELPAKEDYVTFLENYLAASKENPVLGLKDNLINVLLHHKGVALFGGCTGFGCGAAFNFLSLLPDGEVHACRKFPSAIGSVLSQSMEEIYDSDIARQYRSGCAECLPCSLRPVCGGCLACAHSHGLNIFEQKDPFCFL
ncbi:MAG: thio(seleno)oxazole modification radical SAM maturase SbtM [Deltaproteobacteria bacterium]|nr:thio(seleno)oxazole modification radical SAM maturase SbtM [Deltaproteobacteria bacterium]